MKRLLLILLCVPLIGFGQVSFEDGKCSKGDCNNGYGTYVWNNGNKYVGNFEAGARHGKGIFTYHDGTIYEGDFQNNKRHGKGTITYPSKIGLGKYIGDFKDGKYISGEKQNL